MIFRELVDTERQHVKQCEYDYCVAASWKMVSRRSRSLVQLRGPSGILNTLESQMEKGLIELYRENWRTTQNRQMEEKIKSRGSVTT